MRPPLRRAAALAAVLSLGFFLKSASARAGILETGRVVTRQANAKHGVNPSEIVTLRDANGNEVRAIFKPAAGERRLSARGLLGLVPAGTRWRREIAASRLDRALGLGYVPETVERTIDGKVGSLQRWVADGQLASEAERDGRRLDRAAAEKARVFDYLIGQQDRHARNMLIRRDGGRDVPIGIDNGLAFPRGGVPSFRWPIAWVEGEHGPLLAETRRWVRSIDPRVVARTLAGAGLTPDATRLTLRRLERLKQDPDIVEIPPGFLGSYRMVRTLSGLVRSSSQGLSSAERQRIDRIVDRAYR